MSFARQSGVLAAEFDRAATTMPAVAEPIPGELAVCTDRRIAQAATQVSDTTSTWGSR